MLTEIFTPTVLIGCAAGAFAMGYLIINQMRLRLMMLIGSTFYIGYYATAAAEPLYGGIYTTMAMMITNIIGISALTLRRYRISLPKAHADIYPKFDMLTPGDFRMMMKHADRMVLASQQQVTTTGAPASHLYYLLSGTAHVRKRGTQFALPNGVFIGEVAYLLQRPSVADTVITAGSEVLRWDLIALRRGAFRNPRLKLAVDAMLSHDLAKKVSEAVAPHGANPER